MKPLAHIVTPMVQIKVNKSPGGEPVPPDEKATERVIFLLSPNELRAVDALLDGRPRSRWIRAAIAKAYEEQTGGGRG